MTSRPPSLVSAGDLPAIALVFLGAYGAFGLDGLAHYTLALCSQHTVLANVTIWSEAMSGLALLLTAALLFTRRLASGRRPANERILHGNS
jgi:hypothetical protein